MNDTEVTKTTLPSGWVTSRLVDIADIVMGQSPPSSTYNQEGIGLPFFQGKAEFGPLFPTVRKFCSEPKKVAQQDAILLSVRAPVGPVNLASSQCSIGRGLSAIHALGGIPSRFVFYFFKSYSNELAKQATGTTFKAISKKTVENIPITVPPLNEQHRIVAKIEELFSELDAGVAELERARAQLKRYRQALLKAAFEGRLTEQWRRARPAELEPADVLLSRIRAQRQSRWQQQLTDWEQAVAEWEAAGKPGKKPRKPRKPKELPPLTKEELAALPELPEGWAWIHPEEIASPEPYSIGIGPFGSNLKVSDYTEKGIPLIFVRNITQRDFDLNLKFVSNEKFSELYAHSVHPLDIILTKMGDPPGDVAIYPQNRPIAILTADCLKFRIWSIFADRYYCKYSLESPLTKRQLGLITKGVAQKKISVARFKTLLLPMPGRKEQERIAEILKSSDQAIDYFEQTIDQSLQQATALRQAILKKAFSGQLVPQDPGDEPAAVLLERIRGEKEKSVATSKKNSGRRRT